jgi:circadian clock protein KaiC
MSRRLPSGIARLDTILDGGLLRDSINLIIGVPGSGKTMLAQRYAFENGTRERPALYVSTVSEPLDKIVRFGQTLSFFDVAAVGESVIYEDVGTELAESDLVAVAARIEHLLRERHPGIVVIDSFKAFTPFASDAREYRLFLHQLAGYLTATAGTSFWVGEYLQEEMSVAPEFAVADSVISLCSRSVGDRSERVLEVLKLRGSGYASGQHGYRLSSNGLDVFPRLADEGDSSDYALGAEKVSTGIPLLDEILGDGYWPGSSTLVAGPSGIGKTLMGLQFIARGAELGEPGIIASLQENPAQLERVADAFSWNLNGPSEILYASPVDLYIDQWIYWLLAETERIGARRVLIDSLSDLQYAARDGIRFREYMYSLTQRFSRAGVSLLMTSELPDLFTVTQLSEFGVSHLSDNVVLLQYIRDGARIRRALTVLKSRAIRSAAEVREFTIDSTGIALGGTIDTRPSLADGAEGSSAHAVAPVFSSPFSSPCRGFA